MMRILIFFLLLSLVPACAEPAYFDEIIEIEDCFLGRQGDSWRLYNADSSLLLDHAWQTSDFPFGFFFAYPFNGFDVGETAVVQFGSTDAPAYGCIDRSGNIVVSPKYDSLEPFSCGMALYSLDGKFGYVDASGAERIPPVYEAALSFGENLAAVQAEDGWGFINTGGSFAVPAQYDSAGSFVGGSAAVCKGGLYGLIDAAGNALVPLSLKSIGEAFDGLRIAETADGRFGILSTSGEAALPPEYDSIILTGGGTYVVTLDGEESFYTGENGQLIHQTRANAVLH